MDEKKTHAYTHIYNKWANEQRNKLNKKRRSFASIYAKKNERIQLNISQTQYKMNAGSKIEFIKLKNSIFFFGIFSTYLFLSAIHTHTLVRFVYAFNSLQLATLTNKQYYNENERKWKTAYSHMEH